MSALVEGSEKMSQYMILQEAMRITTDPTIWTESHDKYTVFLVCKCGIRINTEIFISELFAIIVFVMRYYCNCKKTIQIKGY